MVLDVEHDLKGTYLIFYRPLSRRRYDLQGKIWCDLNDRLTAAEATGVRLRNGRRLDASAVYDRLFRLDQDRIVVTISPGNAQRFVKLRCRRPGI